MNESRSDAVRGVRFVNGAGGWSGASSSPGVSLRTLSGAAGVDGMLSSGEGLVMGRRDGEGGADEEVRPKGESYMTAIQRASWSLYARNLSEIGFVQCVIKKIERVLIWIQAYADRGSKNVVIQYKDILACWFPAPRHSSKTGKDPEIPPQAISRRIMYNIVRSKGPCGRR